MGRVQLSPVAACVACVHVGHGSAVWVMDASCCVRTAPAVPAAVADVFVAAYTAMEAAIKMLKPGTKVCARFASSQHRRVCSSTSFACNLAAPPQQQGPSCEWFVHACLHRGQNTEVTAIIKSVAESFGVKHIQGNLSHQMKQ